MQYIQSLVGYPLGYIMWAAYELTSNYGVALIIFSILTKLLQFPLAIKQQKQNAENAFFQPMVREIQKKYASNQEKQQEELMKLQEFGYKPTAGCSTMLIQLVVMIGLFDVAYKPLTHILHISADAIGKATEVAQTIITNGNTAAAQLTVQKAVVQNAGAFADIFTPEQISAISNLNFTFFGIDLTQVPQMAFNLLLLVPVLTFLSGTLSQYMTMKFSGQQQSMGSGMSIGMLIFSSVVMTWFAFQMPAAIGMYWIVSNLWQIPQSLMLKKIYDPEKIAAETRKRYEETRKNKNKKKKASKNATKKVKIKQGENEIEKEISEKEYYKLRMAKARELDAEKYKDDVKEDSKDESESDKDKK